MGISTGLHTAMSALFAQQQAMDAVAHNIANVNTPGYTRQRVLLQQSPAPGQLGVGSGVRFQGVDRVRDQFVDYQVRTESQSAGEYRARADSLALTEVALGEPGDGGLRSAMDAFWNSWRDLANAPEQSAARSAVVQAGEGFAFAANRIARAIGDIRADANNRLATAVTEANDLAAKVANLNGRIAEVRASGDPASDLSDERDTALDRLAQLVDMRYVEHENGTVDVFVSGRSMVSGVNRQELSLERDPLNLNFYTPTWVSDGEAAVIRSGEVGGLLHQRDVDLPGRLDDLDALVGQIMTDVNVVHAAGVGLDGTTTGTAFFTGTSALNVAVDGTLSGNLGLLAAATATGAPGDGRNATAIADLQRALSMSTGSEDYGSFYNGIVTRLGVAARDTEGLASAQSLMLSHLDAVKQSSAGVNLDEEMVGLVQYQRGYEAAARVIRAIDEMLQSLIRS